MNRTLRTLTEQQADAYRRTGTVSTAAMVNACAHDCDPLTWPRPAEACTEIGADDDDRPGQGSGVLIWAAVGAAALGVIGYVVKVVAA